MSALLFSIFETRFCTVDAAVTELAAVGRRERWWWKRFRRTPEVHIAPDIGPCVVVVYADGLTEGACRV